MEIDEIKTKEYLQGNNDAKEDINKGIIKYKLFGRLGEWSLTYYKILKDEYGIDYERIAGCLINSEITNYSRGYNDLMNLEIKNEFGNNFLDGISKRVEEVLRSKK